MKRLLLFALLFVAYSYATLAQDQLTTFVLVRHAEKASDGTRDPALTAEGEERSGRLNELFKNADITAIYSSPYKRTRATVAPLAASTSLEVKEYDPRGVAFISDIMKNHTGGTIVVSGHSNTIPFVANELLGNDRFAQLEDSDYGKIFIITVSEVGNGVLTLLNY